MRVNTTAAVGVNGNAPLDGEPLVGGRLRAELIGHQLLRPPDVDRLEEPGWLIDGYVPAGSLATVFGKPGSCKTFLTLDWACSVASGTWWKRREVAQGPVIYVMAEGVGGLRRRKQAWEAANGVQLAEFPIAWYPKPLNLLDPEWAEGLAIVAGNLHAELVVIDTVARAMPGGDENSSRDMGALIQAADRIRDQSGGAVILVHHTPLDGGRLRGHSSLEGAVDTNIGVDSDGATVKVTVEKQKDAEPAEPILLHIETAGESIVLQAGSASTDELPPKALEVLTAIDGADLGSGITKSDLIGVTKPMALSTVHRSVKRLLEAGLCHMVSGEPGENGARFGLTPQGKEALA